MNTDKKIQELYTGVFDEIHASDELLRKVINMSETNNSKKGIRKAVKVLYAVAAVAVLLIASNVIAYASTGENLLHVFINGEEQSLTEEGEGRYTYTYSTDSDEKVEFIVEGEFNEGDTLYIEEGKAAFTPNLNKEGGKTYLVCDDLKIDITEDMKDGSAEGTFELDGIKFGYQVDSDENVMLFYDGTFDSEKDTIEFYDYDGNKK